MPQFTTAVSLLLGLGARIVYNKFFTFRVPGIEDHVLSGLWQGVALYHVLMEFPFITLPVGFGIGARLLVNFVVTYDTTGCACTLLGVAVGVLFTDILSQVLEDGDQEDAYYEGSVVSDYPRRRRLVQLRAAYEDDRMRDHNRRRRAFLEADPSVTTAITNTTNTWDSLSDWIDPNHSMTPLEREVAALRKKASMADSERRRFKEEKQWAQVQGNKARCRSDGVAGQASFHREADLRLLEANNERHRQEVASIHASASQPVAITVGGPSRRSAPSPPPRLIPPPEEERPPLRSAISKGKQPERRVRRISGTNDKDGNPMKAGSVYTGTHHRDREHRRAASVLSRPSVRIEVHETPSRRSKRA
ncbi:hypothetical protein EDB92DRAFT_2103965 [Lactarius akahatsu]|uniref:Uncharacterized protein n=1 Tax=Lactarius akahatsu TaxID=416441 RepID=A0AAD4LEI3_9AGAM|nr:hypothetical protein EDB92DRAFT_2103965 [Lactarius akahatsu]